VPIMGKPVFRKKEHLDRPVEVVWLSGWQRPENRLRRTPTHLQCDLPPRGTLMIVTFSLQSAAGLWRQGSRDVTNTYTMGLAGTVTAVMALASFAFLAGIVLGMI